MPFNHIPRKYQPAINQRILVTGGAGFIGSNLCESLLSNNNEVVCLDNFSTGKFSNIAHLKSHPGFTLIRGDIRSLTDCQDAVEGVDAVLHHAALGSIPRSINDPITSHEVNVTGFLNVLLAAKKNGVRRFIYASSSSVYGDHTSLPKREHLIGLPLSPYATMKRTNELYAHCFSTLYPELEIIGLRYFNIFGPRQTPEGPYAAVIPKFIQALLEHDAPHIYGDGSQSRDFTYIENVLKINHLALTTTNRNAFNQVYNVACEESITLNELVGVLIDYLKEYDPDISYIQPIYTTSRPGDVAHSLASVDKARELLNYHPTHNFKEGLRLLVKYFWNIYKAQVLEAFS
jgi:UDP-N-acetylglucosamine/UDP-N-acetylgalactosamine 4-epimerase